MMSWHSESPRTVAVLRELATEWLQLMARSHQCSRCGVDENTDCWTGGHELRTESQGQSSIAREALGRNRSSRWSDVHHGLRSATGTRITREDGAGR